MIFRLVSTIINLFEAAILIHALLSWFPIGGQGMYNFRRALDSVVEPVLEPIQKFLYKYINLGPIDISPIVALFLLSGLRRVLYFILW